MTYKNRGDNYDWKTEVNLDIIKSNIIVEKSLEGEGRSESTY